MAAKISKNARRGDTVQKLLCKCGNEIKMKTVMQSGKMKHYAYCTGCDKTARKPKDLM